MYIYHSKLSNGASYVHAISGNFSGIRKNAEIIVSRNRVLELYVVDNQGKLFFLCSEYFHFTIRSLAILNWRDRDFLVVASGSGEVFLLHYSPEKNGFLPIIKKTYGMPVTLPELPGHFVATSFGGFALGPLVENYIFFSLAKTDVGKTDSDLNVTQSRCIVYDFIGIQNRTPTFASLEVFCEEEVYDSDKLTQYLKIYNADFKGKKVETQSYALPRHGNKLIHVPEGKSHPDGLIVCYEDLLTFKPLKAGYIEVTRFLPQRKNDAFNSQKGFILTSSTIYEMEGNMVVLAQSEQGDLFSIKLEEHGNKELLMNIVYIDTIPVASAMCIASGKLFIAAEFGDNFIYEIKSLGNESEMIPFKSGDILVTFIARKLENLTILECLKSISPVMQAHVLDYSCNNLKQFVFACGRGPSSTLRLQRYGIKVTTMYNGTLPFFPISVWSVNKEIEGRCIAYIIFSHMRSTVVFALDKCLAVECDTAFNYKLPTLDCAQCTRDSFIQVYHKGFRLIRNNQFTEYKVKKSDILRCALHSKQIALALVNKDGMYFEIEDVNGQVSFKQMQSKFSFMSTVLCMQFIPRAFKAKHLAVCFENCLKLYSVDIMKMECLTTFNLDHTPESIAIVSCEENGTEFNSLINIGYRDGFLQRIAVNEAVVKSEYSMKLGTKPVKLCIGGFNNNVAVLALSNRAWISFYRDRRMLSLAPLDFKEEINYVTFLSAVPSPNANLVALSNKDLYILSFNHWESLIEDAVVKLNYTPNAFVVDSENNLLIIAETDRKPPYHKEEEMTPQKAMDLVLCPPKSPPKEQPKRKKQASVWDSLLHVFDPIQKKTLFKQPLKINEAAVSMALVRFGAGSPQYLLVGVKEGFEFKGIENESYVYMYELCDDGKSFLLVTKIDVEDVPRTICQIEDYVLIGIGKLLCLYSFEQNTKALERRTAEELHECILTVWTRGNLFIIRTCDELLVYGCLEVAEVSLVLFHADRKMRGVTCLCFWDDSVIFVANKRAISAVLLPYYEGCEKPFPDADLSEQLEKMGISAQGSSSQPDESILEPGDGNFKGPSSSQERQSTSRAKTSVQVKPSFKVKPPACKSEQSSEPKPSSSKSEQSSEPKPSSSKSEQSSEPKPSSSKSGPSHFVPKTTGSEPKTSRTTVLISPSGSSQHELDYFYPFARFMAKSYTLVTYKVKESVQSIQRTSLIEEGRDLIVYTTMSGSVGVLVPFLYETPNKMFVPLEYLIFKVNPFLCTEWLAPVYPNGKDIYAQCEDDQVVIDASVCELFRRLKREVQVEIANELGLSVLEVLQRIEEMNRTKYF